MVKFALLLVPLLLMTGLSVDVGYWYNNVANVQKAADAAALAGVVWLPNEVEATKHALAAAARNGYVDGTNGITIEVDPIPGRTRRLKVTITDTRVSSFFWKNLGGRNISIGRSALAEYVLAVPLGSPRNFFGLGDISTTEGQDNLYMAISAWCTNKADGDRFQARYQGNSNSGSASSCPRSSTSNLNDEYRTSGYEVYIEVPDAPRAKAIDVLLFDARYNPGSSQGADSNLTGGSQRDHRYNFELYSPGLNLLDDRDNVLYCTRSFDASTAYDAITFLGRTTGWNNLCSIPHNASGGRWVLRMTNSPRTNTSGTEATGSNTYGVVARYSGEGVCDGRKVTNCPRVFGKDAISVRAFDTSNTADFYLAEIDRIHTGKTLLLELFDPGEGGNTIRIRRPISETSWTDATFSWSSEGVGSGSGVTSLDVTGSKFNGKLVEIQVDLAGYNPPTKNQWWQVRYQFNSGGVTDRTTWSARLLGDPVHLIEEEAP